MTEALTRIPAAAARGFIAECLGLAGLPSDDAARVAELMTEGDLTGADAHGIFRLPQYVQRLRAGGFNLHPYITVTKTAPATALVDGDNGFGHLVLTKAADTAIALAREAGVAWVGVRNSNHAGAAGVYAAMPLAHGMIGLYSAVANANHMAVWGGTDLLLGTNPLAVAIPAGEEAPVVLDIATTVSAMQKVRVAAEEGREMPEGVILDSAGRPTGDPSALLEGGGLMAPLGSPQASHKGFGLGLLVDALSGVLTGSGFARGVGDRAPGNLLWALDVEAFLARIDDARREGWAHE